MTTKLQPPNRPETETLNREADYIKATLNRLLSEFLARQSLTSYYQDPTQDPKALFNARLVAGDAEGMTRLFDNLSTQLQANTINEGFVRRLFADIYFAIAVTENTQQHAPF